MKLNEVFNSPQPWQQTQQVTHRKTLAQADQSMWDADTYKFTIDDREYDVAFSQGVIGDWNVKGAPKGVPKQFDVPVLNMKQNDSFDGWTGEITGTGNAYKVASTVFDVIKKHKKKTGVPILIQAKEDEPSRVKLYSKMFDKIATHKWETPETNTHQGLSRRTNWMI